MMQAGFFVLLVLACVGIIQLVSMGMLALGKRWLCQKRVFVVTQKDWERRLSAIHTYYQWSPSPDTENWLLLDDTEDGSEGHAATRLLAQEMGALHAKAPLSEATLESFFRP